MLQANCFSTYMRMTLLSGGEITFTLSRCDVVLLNPVDVQYHDCTERFVLCKPECAENLATLEQIIHNLHDRHRCFKTLRDILRRVDLGHISRSMINMRQLSEVAYKERALNKEDSMIVGQVENVALSLVQRNI